MGRGACSKPNSLSPLLLTKVVSVELADILISVMGCDSALCSGLLRSVLRRGGMMVDEEVEVVLGDDRGCLP